MRKLKLNTDDLRVESFAPAETADGHGTVRAHGTWDTCIDTPCEPDYSIDPCAPPPTYAYSCGYTCGSTCSCGCNYTRVGWTCDPYASECLPVPEG